MKFRETSSRYIFNKSTYIKLRWIAYLGQTITVLLVEFFFKFESRRFWFGAKIVDSRKIVWFKTFFIWVRAYLIQENCWFKKNVLIQENYFESMESGARSAPGIFESINAGSRRNHWKSLISYSGGGASFLSPGRCCFK